MRPSLRTLAFWLVRVPVGVGAIVALPFVLLTVPGAAVAVASWALPGWEGTALAFAAAILFGAGTAAVARRWFRVPSGKSAGWLDQRVLLMGVAATAIALKGSIMSPGCALGAYALGFTGSPAVPMLIRAAQADDKARPVAVSALKRLGPVAAPAADYLIAHRDTDAVKALGRAASPGLLAVLNDPKSQHRDWAVQCLGEVPVPPEGAVPLAAALADSMESGGTHYIERALVRMGASAAPAVPQLRRLLAAKNPILADSAARVLKAIGPAAAEVVPDLIRTFREISVVSSSVAAETLGAIGPAAVEPLREVLRSARPKSAADACRALALVGPAASAALPDLRPLLTSDDRGIRIEAACAWWRVGGAVPDVLPMLLAEVRHESVPKRGGDFVRTRLIEFGPTAATALPEYTRLLRDPENGIRHAGATLIGALGPAGAPAVDDLTETVRGDPSAEVRGQAVRALRAIGSAAAPAAPAIRDALAGLRPDDRLDAALAVCELDRDAKPLADWLGQELAGKGFRPCAFPEPIERAVMNLGPEARPLIPALEEAYRQESLNRPNLIRLLTPVDRLRAFRHDVDAQAVAVVLVLIACLLIEVSIFRWRERGRNAT